MINIKSLILVVVLSFLLSSCTLIPKPNEVPWADAIELHENPKVGDYAVLRDTQGLKQKTWKVVDIKGNRIEVTQRVKLLKGDPEYQIDYTHHFIVDRKGRLRDAWLLYDNGKRLSRPFARPNEFGSRERYQVLKEAKKGVVKTPKGNIKVDEVVTYIYRLDLGLASMKAVFFSHLSNGVPFKEVESHVVSNTDTGLLIKTLEVTTVAGDVALSGNYAKVYDYANQNYDSSMVFRLVDYGWGK